MGPLTSTGKEPATVRVRDVTRNSFQFQIQEWAYLDGRHLKESISYMVVEEGTHQLKDQTFIEAGRVVAGSNWSNVKFNADFKKAPVVFS